MRQNPGSRVLRQIACNEFFFMKACFLSVALLLAQLLMTSPAIAQERGVRSSLSATTISRDESVTLTIVAIGLDAELDASALDEHFDVIGRSSSRELSTVTGANNRPVTTSIVTWALELIPRDVGIFTVPAVKVGDMRSQIHTLTVNDLPSGASRDIFVEASVDTQTPWVQSQVILTLRVFQAIDILDGGLGMPSGDDLIVERLGDDRRSTEERDGRQYSVTERLFALFPQKSGPMVLEPIVLTVSVPSQRDAVRGFFSPTRKLTRRTDSIRLDVQPRPDAGTAWWLPANDVQLASQWVGGSAAATVDQPLTRRIVMRASGVTDAQLPEISIPAIDGASLYAEQPERAMATDSQGLIAEQIVNWAVIPQRAGLLEVPAITVDWFNTNTGQMETALLPAETLSVSAGSGAGTGDRGTVDSTNGVGATSDSTALAGVQTMGENTADQPGFAGNTLQEPGNASDRLALEQTIATRVSGLERAVAHWRVLALASASLWLATILYYYWSRRVPGSLGRARHSGKLSAQLGAVRQAGTESLQRIIPLSGIHAAVKSGDLPVLQQTLLKWAARQWPEEPPLTLDALAKRLPDSPARHVVSDVNGALYGRQDSAADQSRLQDSLIALPEYLQQALQQQGNEHGQNNGKTADASSTSLPSL